MKFFTMLAETTADTNVLTNDKPIDWAALLNTVMNWVTSTGIKILIALVIMFISFKVINWITRKIEKKGDSPRHDKTVMRTLAYLLKIGLKCVIAVCLIGYLGFDTSAITALITSLGVCFGLAVNGAVANIAGGVLILITRPFKVDDYIEAQGEGGTVEDIHMTYTKLRTPDNKVVCLPNGALANGNIVNYSEKDTRRVDFTFSISYNNDFKKAKEILTKVLNDHPLTLKDQDFTVRVTAHNASSIDIATRAWVKSGDYWTVYFDVLETVKETFDKEGIEIPYNQLDVHVKQD